VISLLLYRGTHVIAAAATGFVTALCAAVMLGQFRQAAAAVTPQWIAAALVLAALVALIVLAIGVITSSSERRPAVAGSAGRRWDVLWIVLAVLVFSGAAYAVAFRTLHEP